MIHHSSKNEFLSLSSILIASIGAEGEPSIYRVAKPVEISKVILLRSDLEGRDPKIISLVKDIKEYFARLEIEVIEENASIDDIENEILEFTKRVASILTDETQLILDCNTGQRYLGTIVRKAAQNIHDFSKFFISRDISIKEAVKMQHAKEIYYIDLDFSKFSLNESLVKILGVIEDDISEVEIGEYSGIGQSTVSTHLKTLRKLGLISIKGRKRRSLTYKGKLIRDLAEVFSAFKYT